MTAPMSDGKLRNPRPTPDSRPEPQQDVMSFNKSWLDSLIDLHGLTHNLNVNVSVWLITYTKLRYRFCRINALEIFSFTVIQIHTQPQTLQIFRDILELICKGFLRAIKTFWVKVSLHPCYTHFFRHRLFCPWDLQCYNPLQVKINSGAILIPTKTLCNDDSQYNMTESWRQLSYSGQLSDSLVICLPTISAESNGVLLKPPIEDLPIKITQGIYAMKGKGNSLIFLKPL